MYPSTIRQKIANNDLLLSTALFSTEAHVAAAVFQTGPDWVWIDQEHSPWGTESLGLICVMARQIGVAGVIRVPWNTPGDIKKAYDSGAVGGAGTSQRSGISIVAGARAILGAPRSSTETIAFRRAGAGTAAGMRGAAVVTDP